MISITSTDIIGINTITTTTMDSLLPSSPSSPSSPPSPPPPSRSVSPPIKSEPTLETKIQITQKSKKKGYLELIFGPMFSGKTSTLKKIYDQCMYCNIPVMVINYSADKRYSNEDVMSTHDKIMIPCIMVNTII